MRRRVDSSAKKKMWALPIGLCVVAAYVALGAQAPAVPNYVFDPGWPKPLPNNWKIGGVTGLAVVPGTDTVWAYNRPNDLTNLELEKETGTSDCCTLAPVDDSFRQGRECDRVLCRASGARDGRRQQGVCVSRAEQRPQIRHAQRKDGR